MIELFLSNEDDFRMWSVKDIDAYCEYLVKHGMKHEYSKRIKQVMIKYGVDMPDWCFYRLTEAYSLNMHLYVREINIT